MRVRRRSSDTFSSLEVRNFRLYMSGQIVSVSGTWMQSVALSALVLELGGRGREVGLVISLQFLPLFVLATLGGLVADTTDNRRTLVCTQAAFGVVSLTLGALAASGAVTLLSIYLLAAAVGVISALDNPSRQTFVYVMVGREQITNAVAVNSVMSNAARVMGPMLAGVTIATVGIAACFVLNALSYAAVIVNLLRIRRAELHARPIVSRTETSMREVLQHVRSTPELWVTLTMLFFVGSLGWNFSTSLPLLAKFAFGGGATELSVLTAAMSVGSIVGGLVLARQNRPSLRLMSRAAVAFGLVLCAVSIAPTFLLAAVAMVPLGGLGILAISAGQSIVQVNANPTQRGRVMALFSMAVVSSTAIGGPIIGWVTDHRGVRASFALAGIAAMCAGALGAVALVRSRREHANVNRGLAPCRDLATGLPPDSLGCASNE